MTLFFSVLHCLSCFVFLLKNNPADDSGFGNLALKGFNEISLPETVSWMPETIGWRFLVLFVFIFLCFSVYQSFVRWKKNRYRGAALLKLKSIEESWSAACNRADEEWLQLLSTVLKATALQAYPRKRVASLSGEAWVRFLNSTERSSHRNPEHHCFDAETSSILSVSQYQQRKITISDSVRLKLIQSSRKWIGSHLSEDRIKKGGVNA